MFNKKTPEIQQRLDQIDQIDQQFGISNQRQPGEHIGYLYNMHESFIFKFNDDQPTSALECYFLRQNLTQFKIKLPYKPYFLISAPEQNIDQIVNLLERIELATEKTLREDTQAPNHVAGQKSVFIKVIFQNRFKLQEFLKNFVNDRGQQQLCNKSPQILLKNQKIHTITELFKYICKFSEYDVTDNLRISIDLNVRCAKWYKVNIQPGKTTITHYEQLQLPPAMRVLAFDIETAKQPLCFPNALLGDQVMCISYMLDGRGVLIINRQIFSQDIEDFEYSPTPQMKSEFKIFNLRTETEVLIFFLNQIKRTQPQIIVSYNGDSFDFKFIHQRCQMLKIDFDGVGFNTQQTKGRFGNQQSEYTHSNIIHIDCLKWVMRDSYLPQGSQGLKAVTKAKLKYMPMELSPELMTPYAKKQPQILAQYSVSDAVATYYLYKKFIESFIFALCTIIPLNPDSVLRKGTGTLCESLLMVEATNVQLLYPDKLSGQTMQIQYIDQNDSQHQTLTLNLKTNLSGCNSIEEDIEEITIQDVVKQKQQIISPTAEQRILISQTYAGGRVEAINSGIYRSDFEYKFCTDQRSSSGYEQLIQQIDQDLEYFIYSKYKDDIKQIIQEETQQDYFYPQQKTKFFIENNISNYNEVRNDIVSKLQSLLIQSKDSFISKPAIYHLDVAAMYPNIILTNRLQPHAVVDNHMCNNCDYNYKESNCKRNMVWIWRGIYYPCTYQEYQVLLQQIQQEKSWQFLNDYERKLKIKLTLDIFCQKTYHSKQKLIELLRQSTICQRENPFFVDTVRNFRNRRYEFKRGQAAAANRLNKAEDLLKNTQLTQNERQQLADEVNVSKALIILNESLQLAHKAILNSFYGYAMRAGSRWFSMEMAACVTFVGSQIIRCARALVEKIGIPLELDTDGIWCMLPVDFPDNYVFNVKNKKEKFQYPAIMLNAITAQNFSNSQFQERVGSTHQFEFDPECSIEFEIDGPYRAMFLSAAKEEGKKIKKRYCVFNFDGGISELKGFELKRRGELQLIKSYQARLFTHFLDGKNIYECYNSTGNISTQFLNIVKQKGQGYSRKLVLELLQESSTMKLSLKNTPPNKKSAAVTTAKRLSKYLDEVFSEVTGLTCQYVISKQPSHLPVSERAIPVQIFKSSEEIQRNFLQQWTLNNSIELCQILDWEYYEQRFVNCLLRLIVVPAGLQDIKQSPIPLVPYPDWLQQSHTKQITLQEMMQKYQNNLENEDSVQEGSQEESKDEDSKQEQSEGEEEQPLRTTVQEILTKFNININTSEIQLLHSLQNNKITRSESASMWLENQQKKWKLLIMNEQLNKSLMQISRETYQLYNVNQKHKIVSNDIFSQLQGKIKAHKYIVLSAATNNKNVNAIELILLNIQQKEIFTLNVLVKKEILINSKKIGIETLEDENVNIYDVKVQEQKYQKLPQGYIQFQFLPDQQKIKNLYLLEIQQDFYSQNVQFYDLQFSNTDILNVYHKQITPVERFLLYKGCFVQLTKKGCLELDFGQLSFENIQNDHSQSSYIFDNKKQKFLIPITFCILARLTEGEIFCTVDQYQFTINSTIQLSTEDMLQVYEAFIERLQQLIKQLSNFQSGEKLLLCNMLKQFNNLQFSSQVVLQSQKSLYERYTEVVKEYQQNGLVITYIESQNYQYSKRGIENKEYFTKNTNLFIKIKNLNILTQDLNISEALLELIALYSSLESQVTISKIPIVQIIYNQSFYNMQVQNTKICSLDFLYAKQLLNNYQVLWFSHTNQPDFGKKRAPVENNKQLDFYNYQAHCRGYTVFFDVSFMHAQVIALITASQNKQLSVLSKCIPILAKNSQLLSFLQEYLENFNSLLYNQQNTNYVKQQINTYLYQTLNFVFNVQLQPVYISAHKFIISSDKLEEQLAFKKFKQFVFELLQKSPFLSISVGNCFKQLLYQDLQNYIGISLANTIICKSVYQQLIPERYFQSAQTVIVGYMMCLQDNIDQIEQKTVSLLQLGDCKHSNDEIFSWVKNFLIGAQKVDFYQSFSQQLITNMLNITQLRLDTYNSQIKSILSPDQKPGWLYLSFIFKTIGLDKNVEDQSLQVLNGMRKLFEPHGAETDIKQLPDVIVDLYCTRCQEYIHLNISKDLQNLSLKCLNCYNQFQKYIIEQLVFDKMQQLFLMNFVDTVYLFDEYIELLKLYQFRTVVNQLKILKQLI